MTRLARLRTTLQGERGSGLVESLVAVAIAGTAVVAFVIALSTGSIAVGVSDQQAVAQSLTQSQLEYIGGQNYADTYHPFTTPPEGYAISIEVGPIPGGCTNIQKITITISREGEDILTVETYRVNR